MTLYLDRLRKWNQRFVDEGKFSFRMQSACPGFDNRGCAGWGRDLAYLGREEGEHYRRQWQQHVKHRDEIDAVLVVTWNDFTETTVVEPTVEFGYREIATTQEYAAKFKDLPHDPAGLELPERLFTLRKDRAWLARTGFELGDTAPKLDQAGRCIAAREYAQAADLLDDVKSRFADLHSQTAQEVFSLSLEQGLEVTGPSVETEGTFEVKRAAPLALRVDELIAQELRERNFEANLSFDYLDQGVGRVQVAQVPIARPVEKGLRRNAKFWQVCDIHLTDTGLWLPARVHIYKQTSALNHKGLFDADFAFLADTRIRNIRMDFTTHRRIHRETETSSAGVDAVKRRAGSFKKKVPLGPHRAGACDVYSLACEPSVATVSSCRYIQIEAVSHGRIRTGSNRETNLTTVAIKAPARENHV